MIEKRLWGNSLNNKIKYTVGISKKMNQGSSKEEPRDILFKRMETKETGVWFQQQKNNNIEKKLFILLNKLWE